MSTATRTQAVKENWSAMRGSLLSGAGITQTGNLDAAVVRLTADTIGDWVAGYPHYNALKALRDLFTAYDADMNAIDANRVPWARQGKTCMVAIVANLDGEV